MTFPRRQTACRMRHCCARRIDGCLGRRKLVSTSTRSAERQRIIEAEANRIATLNAATPRYGQCNRQALQLFELLACNEKRLSFGRAPPVFFLGKENGGCIRAAPLALLSRGTSAAKCSAPARKMCAPLGARKRDASFEASLFTIK